MDKLQLFTVGLFLAVCLICNTGKFGFIYYVLSLICVLYPSNLNVFSYRFIVLNLHVLHPILVFYVSFLY